ncbi:PstS family phosphate ABC transporter substrate-binding protein [Floridanema aerugineum]|uniref:Phosphate-binding protein n=1 Tax=Floridaenema aerugineum BLCC-F46 TaxID=3153654 RepID=A0ABV4XJC3_9CYAN
MNATEKPKAFRLRKIALIVGVAALLNSCAEVQSQQKPIKIDGSSTVYPITSAIAKNYQKTNPNTKIETGFSGTTGGFRKFCAKEVDIADASRPINAQEMQACNKAGVRFIELPVAFDALTVVVNPQNTWAQDITVAELKRIWEPAAEGKITNWNQVRPGWPDRPLKLFGPGKDSGTFDYFTEAVVGKVDASRNDYTASEDDEVIAKGVIQDPNALGYFGLAYYEDNQGKLKAVPVNSGKGAIAPSLKTVEANQYQPLARPLFIYVNAKAAQDNPELKDFVKFYIKNAPQAVKTVGYVPLPEEGYRLAEVHFNRAKVGTVFDGKAQLDLTLAELLRKQAKF